MDDFTSIGAKVHRVYNSRIDSMLRPGRLAARLRELGPDVVHVHGVRACRLCADCPYPVVATVHNNLYADFKHEYGEVVGHLFEKIQVRDLKLVDRVVACSSSNAEALDERYQILADTILNGVDRFVYSPASCKRRKMLRCELGVSEDAFVFVASCGCSTRKRTLQLVDTFMNTSMPERVVLYVLGEGPLFEECREHADEKKVIVVGRCDHVERWLACSDRFVSLSEAEGMPMAVLEAAACGLPLILSAIPPHVEIASALPEGSCELVSSTEDLAFAISRSVAHLDSFTPYKIPDTFYSDRMAEEYLAVYLDLAGREL